MEAAAIEARHRAAPQDVEGQRALLEACAARGALAQGIMSLAPASVTLASFAANEALFREALDALQDEAGVDVPRSAFTLLRSTAAEPASAIAILMGLRSQTIGALVQRLGTGEIDASDADLVTLADQLSICALPSPAKTLFDALAARLDLDFHLALLGARIAAQCGARDDLVRHWGTCERAAAADPALASASPLYDALALLTSPDEDAMRSRAGAMAARCDAAGLDVELAIHVLLGCPDWATLAPAFAVLAERTTSRRTATLAAAVHEVLAGDPACEATLGLLASKALAYPSVARLLLDHAIGSARAPADLKVVLDRLDLSHGPTRGALRQKAADLQARGNVELARAIGARLASGAPGEHWTLIQAIDAAHRSGRLQEAQSLAHKFDLDAAQGPILADIGLALAKVGLLEKADAVLTRADKELGSRSVPERIALAMGRALMATGDPDRALAWYDRIAPARSAIDPDRPAILDPGHHDGAGHHVNNGRFTARLIADRLGTPPALYVSRTASASALAGLDVRKTFAFEPYVYNAFEMTDAALANLNASFCAELMQRFAGPLPPLVYAHSMRFNMLHGLLAALLAVPTRPRTLAVIDLVEADLLGAAPLDRLAADLAELSERLAARSDVRLMLFGQSDPAVDWLRRALPGMAIEKLPYLAASRCAQLRRRPHSDQAPTFGLLGATRPERGHAALLRAIGRLGERGPRFVLQVDRDALETFADGAELLARAKRGRDLTLLAGTLDPAAYDDALEAIDCLVLPYTGRYAVSGSGVLFEAIYALRYVIVSRGSTLADELADYAYPHALVDPGDPGELAAAIEATVRDWPRIQAALARFDAHRPPLPMERFEARLQRELAWLRA